MARLATMSTLAVRALAASIVARGLRADVLLADVGIDIEALADPDGRVPAQAAFQLFELAANASGDPYFGLHAGASMAPGAMEVLEHATRASRTLGEAFERIARYYPLLVEGIEMKLSVERDTARLIHRAEPPLRPTRNAVDMLLATILSRTSAFTGRVLPLRRVRLTYARPLATKELDHFFRAPIEFGQPFDELVFDAAIMDTPLITADPTLAPVLDRFVATLLAKLPVVEPFLAEVRRAVADTLPGQEPSLERTARRLGTSARTLQRRLNEVKTSYAAVVDQLRNELALQYLAESHIALAEISYVLGFSQPSAFHRAFKRWTGSTPAHYRRTR